MTEIIFITDVEKNAVITKSDKFSKKWDGCWMTPNERTHWLAQVGLQEKSHLPLKHETVGGVPV